MQVKIQKWGNSQGIRIPKHVLESARLKEADSVEIMVEDENIIIRKAAPDFKHKTIEELFEGYEGDYEPIEIDWGKPVGREIW